MSADIEKKEEIDRFILEKKEGRIKFSWWRKQWAEMQLPLYVSAGCIAGGLLMEFSSNIFTIQTFYEVADKSTNWLEYFELTKELSKSYTANWSVCAWVAFAVGNDIAKSIMIPLSFQAISEGLVIKGTGCLVAGFVAAVISHYSTIASMGSHYETEKIVQQEIKRHNNSKQEINKNINDLIANNNALINQKKSLSEDYERMGRSSIKTKLYKINKANNAANAALKAQENSTALLSQQLKNEKLNEVKKVDGITSLYNSLAKMYFVEPGMTEEQKEVAIDKARLSFQSYQSIFQELMGAILLALGMNMISKKLKIRKDEEDEKKNSEKSKKYGKMQKAATPYGIRSEDRMQGGLQRNCRAIARRLQRGFRNAKNNKKNNNINVNYNVENNESTERFTKDYLDKIMLDIKEGRVISLRQRDLMKIYSCGQKSAEKIRKYAIQNKIAKKNYTTGNVYIIGKEEENETV